jgi:hypothetical protein
VQASAGPAPGHRGCIHAKESGTVLYRLAVISIKRPVIKRTLIRRRLIRRTMHYFGGPSGPACSSATKVSMAPLPLLPTP